MTDPTQRVVFSSVSEGVMGYAIESGRVVSYPSDPGSVERYLGVDHRTRIEFAAPISLNGTPTGVLLVDFFEKEKPTIAEATICGYIDIAAKRISAALDSHARFENELRVILESLVEKARDETRSLRGYVAVRRPDGELSYFWKDDEGIFLHLSATEGLCGKAFRTGQEIHVSDVWKEPDYVASDPKVRSELIIPIVVNRKTVAIFNLESDIAGHFTSERRDRARQFAFEATQILSRHAITSRQPGEMANVLGALVEEGLGLEVAADAREGELRIVNLVVGKLGEALGRKVAVWRSRSDPPPHEVHGVKWNEQMSVEVVNQAGGEKQLRIVVAPIRTLGFIKAIVAVIFDGEPAPEELNVITQSCRLATVLIENQGDIARASELEKALWLVTRRPDSVSLQRMAVALARILRCDHCTIFGLVDSGPGAVLCVAASTAAKIRSTGETYYKIEDRDGLTGYVAYHRVGIYYDGSARLLDRYGWSAENIGELSVNPPTHRGKLSEEQQETLSAYVAMPVFKPGSAEIMGVVRLHRLKRKGQGGRIDTQSIRRLILVCDVLGAAFSSGGFFGSVDVKQLARSF